MNINWNNSLLFQFFIVPAIFQATCTLVSGSSLRFSPTGRRWLARKVSE
ncbi:hypothetical protein NAL19_4465 [Pectobacterium sp. F1-1]|nr:hypothetical protein NAL19_4465 [Pectobacterium sp. F1-1]